MSQERDVTVVGAAGTKTAALTEEKVSETRAQKKARIARVLERGVVIDRAAVALPPNLHGEWCHKDPVEIERMRALGFWVDGEGGRERHATGLHSDGDGTPMIGDVVFMVTDKENKELIDEVRTEQYQKTHGKPGEEVREQPEEKGFKGNVAGLPTPIIEESSARTIRKAELEAILTQEKK